MSSDDRRELIRLINEWNSSRYDLFALSQPNENLEFHGVMRFYFQDAGQKVSTKCVRVDSTASTDDVIEVLIEKFRPDMKTLSSAKDYAIYEVNSTGDERKLSKNDRPLWVQLDWGKDGREGRFLLKNENDKTVQFEAEGSLLRDRKRQSKRDKKKQAQEQSSESKTAAEKLYKEVPDSNFTRSISNPEIVMARRRQQKFENKLKQIKSRDGGGTLKVFGETLKPDIPYKTLLMSNQDTAAFAVRETLDKYGMSGEDPDLYCLVQVLMPSRDERERGIHTREFILEDTACPLAILMQHPPTGGSIIFQIRKCPSELVAKRRARKASEIVQEESQPNHQVDLTKVPFLIELDDQGYEMENGKIIPLKTDYLELGSSVLESPGVEKQHCAIRMQNNTFILLPYFETYVNEKLIKEPCVLQNNFLIRFGRYALYRFHGSESPPHQQQPPNHKTTPVQPTQVPPNYGTLYDNEDKADSINNKDAPTTSTTNAVPNVGAGTSAGGGLPGILEFSDENEMILFKHLSQSNTQTCSFKLAPVYTMYMMLRYKLSQQQNQAQLVKLIFKMVNMIRDCIDQYHTDRYQLPFWMANSSELLYFLKSDCQLKKLSLDAQELLAEYVQMTFKYLVNLMQQSLDQVLSAFIDPSDHVEDINDFDSVINIPVNPKRPTLRNVINVLNETMNLLRGSRVNAALTIQLFSQLFHFVSTWLFNKLVCNRSGLCCRYWGVKLMKRLNKIQLWAEKQGLELAADCHLSKIIQAAFLLQASKHDQDDLSTISSNCYALNSLQIKCLLKNYLPAQGEPALSPQLASNLIAIAQSTADEFTRSEGRLLQVEEEIDLQLPFLLPEDGHSCDIIKGLPSGLLDYIEQLQNVGLCWLWQNTQGPGNWTEHMKDTEVMIEPPQPPLLPPPQVPNLVSHQPQIIKISLSKRNGGLGLSIVAAKAPNNPQSGIYIKSVVPGGAAHQDGRLEAGDMILAVDENSLIGITQERAADLLTKSGPIVVLTVAKEAAAYHGLDALLVKQPTSGSMPQLTTAQNPQFPMPPIAGTQQNTFSSQTLPPPNRQPERRAEVQQLHERTLSQDVRVRQLQQQQQQHELPKRAALTSPTNRGGLPNETQLRYGSERPPSHNSYTNPSLPLDFATTSRRTLPNEINRFGSERPYKQEASPIKSSLKHTKINEIDEKENTNNNNNNNLHELYGRVNNSNDQFDGKNQSAQYGVREGKQQQPPTNQPKSKSSAQLYEQIWNTKKQDDIRVIPFQQQQQQQMHVPRNYENQTVKQQQVVAAPPPPPQASQVTSKPQIRSSKPNVSSPDLPPPPPPHHQQLQHNDDSFTVSFDYQKRLENRLVQLERETKPRVDTIEIKIQREEMPKKQVQFVDEENYHSNNQIKEDEHDYEYEDYEQAPVPPMRNSSIEISNQMRASFKQLNEIDTQMQSIGFNQQQPPALAQQKHVQFNTSTTSLTPTYNRTTGNTATGSLSNISQTPEMLQINSNQQTPEKRVMFSDFQFDRQDSNDHEQVTNTPSVIGANEVYLDPRAKLRAQKQAQQNSKSSLVEGEKLSFKDKMKLFAKELGEQIPPDTDPRAKASKKQREIELKMN